jgi:hypothetical protein
MSRTSEVLRAAASALEEGTDPFNDAFLREHDITLDECFTLAEHLALGAQLLAWAMDHPQEARAAAEGASTNLRIRAFTELMSKADLSGILGGAR